MVFTVPIFIRASERQHCHTLLAEHFQPFFCRFAPLFCLLFLLIVVAPRFVFFDKISNGNSVLFTICILCVQHFVAAVVVIVVLRYCSLMLFFVAIRTLLFLCFLSSLSLAFTLYPCYSFAFVPSVLRQNTKTIICAQ